VGHTGVIFNSNSFNTSVKSNLKNKTLKTFLLEQNYPNPFNPLTKIKYSLSKSANVKIEVYNLLGQKVAVLINGEKPAGYHEISFNASSLSSGMYIYKLKSGSFEQSRKMILIR